MTNESLDIALARSPAETHLPGRNDDSADPAAVRALVAAPVWPSRPPVRIGHCARRAALGLAVAAGAGARESTSDQQDHGGVGVPGARVERAAAGVRGPG